VPIIPFYLFGHLAFDPKTYLTMAVGWICSFDPCKIMGQIGSSAAKKKNNMQNNMQTQSEEYADTI